MKSLKKYLLILLALSSVHLIKAQERSKLNTTKPSFYIGYDLGEMAFNKFQNFAGEVGFKFKNNHTIRFVYLNVKLTEQHLSSNFASSVDGENVSGLWNGHELLYDVPIYRFKKGSTLIYGGVSAGYHKYAYQHTILNESLEHNTGTVGIDLGFRETNVFNVKGLYMNFQIPIRYYFNKLEETKLGSSTVNKVFIEQTISFFVGYEF